MRFKEGDHVLYRGIIFTVTEKLSDMGWYRLGIHPVNRKSLWDRDIKPAVYFDKYGCRVVFK